MRHRDKFRKPAFPPKSPKIRLTRSVSEVVDLLRNSHHEVVVTLGAGDIDTLLPEIEELFRENRTE